MSRPPGEVLLVGQRLEWRLIGPTNKCRQFPPGREKSQLVNLHSVDQLSASRIPFAFSDRFLPTLDLNKLKEKLWIAQNTSNRILDAVRDPTRYHNHLRQSR